MSYFAGVAIETAVGFALWLPVLILWSILKRWNIRKTLQMTVFLLYITAVFDLVGLPGLKYLCFAPDFYFGAFVGMLDDRINSVLNVFLFIPFGFFVRSLCRDSRPIWKTVLAGFCFSLFIETAQIFSFRLTDVNDLITNTAGTFLGACAAGLFTSKITPQFRAREITAAILLTGSGLFLVWQYVLDYIWML